MNKRTLEKAARDADAKRWDPASMLDVSNVYEDLASLCGEVDQLRMDMMDLRQKIESVLHRLEERDGDD